MTMEKVKDQLKCVTIEHLKNNTKEYRWLSGYFRMLGIFVVQRNLEITSEVGNDSVVTFSFVEKKDTEK
ncbi:MAG: hypothetical protein Q4D32_08545, partial [Eubacteriales bacterium]|nr:hypothetical protein [Eubacteriales bacterium]